MRIRERRGRVLRGVVPNEKGRVEKRRGEKRREEKRGLND